MFDRNALIAACRAHGTVARVVVASVKGSAPREVGAAMLVWAGGQSGTIGGGALEFQAAQNWQEGLTHHALGPDLGQCCGGAVSLLTEVYDLPRALALPLDMVARPVAGGEMPLAIKRILARVRSEGFTPAPSLVQGWFIEPVAHPKRRLWIWGAGHVGRALVQTLSPLPNLALHWADIAPDRFPDDIAPIVAIHPTPGLPALMTQAAPSDEHLILTFSHALDLALCDAALRRGFKACGLIGSASKWARFRSRLRALGHTDAQISRIACPIGDPSLGKHPQAIAIGVAAALLRGQGVMETAVRA
jgi:xanthine dehydrogenase accessory factor